MGRDPRARRHVWVSGRVQGVWFRRSCADVAEQLGLAGWVRNDPDGRVEAVFEGDEEVVGRMVEWCRHGPAHAVVASVEISVEQPRGDSVFEVK